MSNPVRNCQSSEMRLGVPRVDQNAFEAKFVKAPGFRGAADSVIFSFARFNCGGLFLSPCAMRSIICQTSCRRSSQDLSNLLSKVLPELVEALTRSQRRSESMFLSFCEICQTSTELVKAQECVDALPESTITHLKQNLSKLRGSAGLLIRLTA